MSNITYEEADALISKISEPIPKDLKDFLVAMGYWHEDDDEPYLSYDDYDTSPNSVLLILKHKVEKEYE